MRGLSRRALLAGLSACALPLRTRGASAATASAGTAVDPSRALYIAGCKRADGTMAAALFDDTGDLLLVETLSARAHGAAVSPSRRTVVLFARRPGRFAIIVDVRRRERTGAFAPPADRRFAGHGAFSADGKLLFAAENDFEAERGVLGIYETTNFSRVGEFDTHGVGPHEILLLADGKTIAVANGGIATHPDFPRMKLNLPTMAPSLALIDAHNGTLITNAHLPKAQHQLSIRHIAERENGEIWFGAQYEGNASDQVPLVGTLDTARGLQLCDVPDRVFAPLRQYVGSVALSRDGARALTTSPRGGIALEWDTSTRSVRAAHRIRDVCGAAPHGGAGLLWTAGTGALGPLGDQAARTSLIWDNHATAIV